MRQRPTRQLKLLEPTDPRVLPSEVEAEAHGLLVELLAAMIPILEQGRTMNRITAEHLARKAYVYIRQSTADQVQHNAESKRRQYGLVDRARELGFNEVLVIDDDLGRSGSGVHRPGFERLLAALCEGQVGAVFCIVSWLRNQVDTPCLVFCEPSRGPGSPL
jgi:hypothetical protein